MQKRVTNLKKVLKILLRDLDFKFLMGNRPLVNVDILFDCFLLKLSFYGTLGKKQTNK